MNESIFLNYTDMLFDYLEYQIEKFDEDLDINYSGNVLSVKNDDGKEIIVNRHTPNRELWIAAPSGGYHFKLNESDSTWISTRDNVDFFTMLNRTLEELSDKKASIPPIRIED